MPFQLNHFFPDPQTAADKPVKQALEPKPEEEEPKGARLAAFGDIMMHSPQVRAGKKADGSYDFRSFFTQVKPYIESADIAIGNFETTLAGPSKPYSGFPRFNAPDAIADALRDTGVDLVSTANNHSMDTGTEGAIRTYQVLNEAGIKPVGTAPSAEDRHATVVEKNGITFAFLAYTEWTNGLPVPKDKPYLVNLIDTEQIARDIREAREHQGADFVCVSLHFGVEYQRHPNLFQINTARQVLEDGADVILGSHPHVLQPMEKVTINGQEKLIIYSMGNFISNQRDLYTDEGIIIYMDVEKDPKTKQIILKNVSFLPTYVHRYRESGISQYAIIPMETNKPESLPHYPAISESKWRTTWEHTQSLMKKKGSFPTFSLKQE